MKLLLGSLPHRLLHDRLMLTGMVEVLVPDLTDVNRIREQRVKCPAGERVPARLDSALCGAPLGNNTAAVQIFFEQPHAAEFLVAPENIADDLCLRLVDHNAPVADLIPQWHNTAHPYAFAFGGRNFVADPFPRHLALELGEGEQDVERQASHRSRRIELLGDRDEGDCMRVEHFHHLGEVGAARIRH